MERAIASKQAESVGFSVIFASEPLRLCALASEVCCHVQSDRGGQQTVQTQRTRLRSNQAEA